MPEFFPMPEPSGPVTAETLKSASGINDLIAENEQLRRERDQAVREAASRDQKWMDGINAVCGVKLSYDSLCLDGDRQHYSLDEFIGRLKKDREGWQRIATYLARSLIQVGDVQSQLVEMTEGTPDDEDFASVTAEVYEKARELDHHLTGTDIGVWTESGLWYTKDGWSPVPPFPDIGVPKRQCSPPDKPIVFDEDDR